MRLTQNGLLLILNIQCMNLIFRKASWLLFLTVYLGLQASAQTRRIDSLRNRLAFEKGVNKQQDLLLKLCEQNFSLSADSLSSYVKRGLTLCKEGSTAHFRFKNFYCFYFLKMGKATEAIRYTDSLMKQASSESISTLARLELRYHRTVSLIRDNQYKESIASALNLLGEGEKSKDTLSVLRAYSLLGWANMELESEREAIQWLNKGLRYTTNQTMLANANSLFLNIASCYNLINQPDSALYYINNGLGYCLLSENLTSQANALNIRAAIYSRSSQPGKALHDLENALVIRQKVGDLHYIISDMGQLAHFYAYVNQPEKGIAIALEGIPLAIQANNIYKLIYLKKGLEKNYEAANRKDDAIRTLVDILHLKDSLYEENTEADIAEMKTKYELTKKENIIIQQKAKLLQNRYVSVGSGIAFLLGGIIVWLAYRNHKHKQERKMEQALAEEKIHSIHAVKQAEEKERKRIAADLHDNLGSYAAAITSNIRYLKESGSGENEQLIAQLDENAQGIVTQLSDSIWVLKNEQLEVTKLADRFKSWAQRLIQNYPGVKYFYEEEISNDIEFTPGKMLNIFLILKESLNNALKHSQCTEIRIQFISTDRLLISIEDNGKGFASGKTQGGNGVENIKYRAAQSDLTVRWETSHPTGTKIVLSSTTTN